ncbi:B3/B4 domain-containing protein [Anaerosolibacter sp.]|uniref:B3/B4 domain-containing protein n=1 Tax=Anaerosolibacter sp. TaxID=1872527 RepID=UPI0039EE2325
MKKFVVENEFWDVFPKAKIGVVISLGIDNHKKEIEKYEEMIMAAEKEAMEHIQGSEFSDNKVIKVWREAFQKFKTKKGARSSIEALLKRVHNGNHIGSINPLVDIYNAISLKYAFPCGGEDIDTFVGDIRLTRAVGDEEFIPLGSDENAPPYEGEVIYRDDAGAICRCWNWREAVRTALTENTKNAFLCLELVDENRYEDFENALKKLEEMVSANIGGTSRTAVLDVDHREVLIKE